MAGAETWIDEIASLAGEVSDGRGGFVESYRVFTKDNFPESLSVFPCALTYITKMLSTYSDAGPALDLWEGITEFHLTPDVKKNQYPFIMRFYSRIRNAFALHRTLSGKVAYCLMADTGASIEGPVILQYGSEEPHFGLLAHWIVKENVSGTFTLGV